MPISNKHSKSRAYDFYIVYKYLLIKQTGNIFDVCVFITE